MCLVLCFMQWVMGMKDVVQLDVEGAAQQDNNNVNVEENVGAQYDSDKVDIDDKDFGV